MKQYQINTAYGALNRLAGLQMPVRDSYNVYMLLKKLEPTYKFELEQEQKILAKFGGQVGEGGVVTFSDPGKAEGFKKEISELNDLEVDIEICPIRLNCDIFEDAKFSPYDMISLDGFVEFE